jgi:hypothetical protein
MRTALLTPGTNERRALLAPVTHEALEVNPNALAGMAMIRRFGMADMYDRERVIRLVAGLGFRDGADWLRAHRHLYFVALQEVVGAKDAPRPRL